MRVVLDNLDVFVEGARTTAVLTFASYAVALVVGLMIATFRVSPIPPLRLAGTTYVTFVRNSPLTVLFFLFFFGLTKVGILFSPFPTAVIVLGGYTGSFVGETIRSGINTVNRGQAEAARAIGLTFPQTLVSVVLPQALRSVVAPLGSLFIALTKNSSIASLFVVEELTFKVDSLANNTARGIPVFVGAALMYLAMTIPSGIGVAALERRVAIKR